MVLIKTVYQGTRQTPLMNAMEFILINCCCIVNVEKYPRYRVIGNRFITNTEYRVEISVDEDEIHAYFRWPTASRPVVLEIIFFQNATTAPSTNHAT